MTKDEFIAIFSENPNDDRVLEEINRVYDSESRLTSDFNQADSDRQKFSKELEEANRRYRERFLTGEQPKDNDNNNKTGIDSLFTRS